MAAPSLEALDARLRFEAEGIKLKRRVPTPSPYLADPAGWIADKLGEHLWSKQRIIAEAVRDYRRVAVPSAHSTGKSFLAARLACHWLECHPPGEAFVLSTAPTGQQVRGILWREINRAHAAGHLRGHTNQTEWWIGTEMVAFGRKPSDYEPDAFKGIHARYVLVILDEASGIPESLFLEANAIISNEHSRILAIGNPDDPQSHFATICAPGSDWHVIEVDGLQTPNFTGESIPDSLRDLLISPVYVEEMRRDVGEDSPVFKSKVRGQFPGDTPDGVIPLSWIRACQRLDREYAPDDLLPVELGVDVGAGGDETVIRERRGMAAGRNWRYRTPDSAEAIGHIIQAIRETGATKVKVDVIGIGWGVVGGLKDKRSEHNAEIVGVNVAAASSDPKRFPKLRDQLWWEVGREFSRQQAWDLAAVDEVTVAQLIAPTWKPDAGGRYQIEPKAETRKRLRRSPDDADSLLLCFAEPPREPSRKVVAW